MENQLSHADFPPQLVVETTAACNQDCIFCGRTYSLRPLKTMKVELLEKIFREVAAESPDTEIWPTFMGEATMLPQIFDHIAFAKQIGCRRVTLNSNGSRLDEAMCEKIISSGLDRFIISMDAATPETHAKVRPATKQPTPEEQKQKNDQFFWTMWNGTLKLIEIMKSRSLRKPLVEVQFSVFKENVQEWEGFRDFWIAQGAIVKVRPMMAWSGMVKAEQSPAYDVLTGDPRPAQRMPCKWAFDTMGIHWNGSVVACAVDSEGKHVAGSVEFQTIKEIWNNQLWYLRELHRQGRFRELPEPCRGCPDWHVKKSLEFFPSPESKQDHDLYVG